MFDDLLSPVKDRILIPLVRPLARAGWSPQTLTWAAFVCGLAAALALGWGQTWPGGPLPWALGLWGLNRLLDGLDGLLARVAGRTSPWGGYLDLFLDFIVYAALPLALVFGPEPGLALPVAALLGAFYINAASWMPLSALTAQTAPKAPSPTPADAPAPNLRPRGSRPTAFWLPRGLMEGAETVLLYTLLIAWPEARAATLWAGAGLTLAGALIRAVQARRHLRSA